MAKKILLFGATGFIGSSFKGALEKKGYEVHGPRIEVTDASEVQKTFTEIRPDIAINATGKTGAPNVDWCETHPMETLMVNVSGSLNIAAIAYGMGVHIVQVCSGCLYSGDNGGKGFTEESEPNYSGSLYTRSRIYSEKLLKEFPNVLQLRIRIPLIGRPHPKNLIDKLLRYPTMINIPNSCTVMEDFIPAAIQLMEMGEKGVFNMTNIGAMDHKSIMEMYKEIVDPAFEISLMPEKEQAELCLRRSNCVLNTDKREKRGVHMPPLADSLRRILKEYKANAKKT
ncbi:sugar nucleotide-binding protein [Candidatus Peregrinibacteria bacterium]|nr:sugar nucleotide-binding protein [Candidatus Peregrinibacteria bacterium]